MSAAEEAVYDGFSDADTVFITTTRAATVDQSILNMCGQAQPKVDLWCVDGAATASGTYDRARCFNIRPCNTSIKGANANDTSMVCKEVGDTYIVVVDESTGKPRKIVLRDVLINAAFPFHIFSEIKAFENGCTASKSLGS